MINNDKFKSKYINNIPNGAKILSKEKNRIFDITSERDICRYVTINNVGYNIEDGVDSTYEIEDVCSIHITKTNSRYKLIIQSYTNKYPPCVIIQICFMSLHMY